jgi:hypothetical protein
MEPVAGILASGPNLATCVAQILNAKAETFWLTERVHELAPRTSESVEAFLNCDSSAGRVLDHFN